MPSPFPGMDPYLEGVEWQSFHAQFACEFVRQLSPQLLPHYFARPVPRTALADSTGPQLPSTRFSDALASLRPERVPQIAVEIRDVRQRRLVTRIELHSLADKHPTGRAEYLKQRSDVLMSSAHLLEIDLLHEGEPLPMGDRLPATDYYVVLSRADLRPRAEVWPIRLREPLPSVPVPLQRGDADASLDLQAAFDAVYDSVGYRYTNDYSGPPPVALAEGDLEWIDERLRAAGLRS